jgi:N-acetylglucosamine kinase-like BadF-type ATPase
MSRSSYLLALEGGGTRCKAVLFDSTGEILVSSQAGSVNTNFMALEEARKSVRQAVQGVLAGVELEAKEIGQFVLSLVGPRFGAETFADLLPSAEYSYYPERDVIFARAGIYRPHGVAVVAATGATAWAVRSDDGREVALGGWGSLLGDEGSAYSIGLLGLRQAARAWEGRLDLPTRLPQVLCVQFGFQEETFKPELVKLAYGKPLSRSDIAGLAPLVVRLSEEGDLAAKRIIAKVADDLASLAVNAARLLFAPRERFNLAAGGGLLNAGECVVGPLRERLSAEFPAAVLLMASQDPAEALGRLALSRLKPGLVKGDI